MDWLIWSPFQEPNFNLLIVPGSSIKLHPDICLQTINDSIILWFGMIFMIDLRLLCGENVFDVLSFVFHLFQVYKLLRLLNHSLNLGQLHVFFKTNRATIFKSSFIRLCDPLKQSPLYIKNASFFKAIIFFQEILRF